MPLNLVATLDELVAIVDRLDEPLAAGDDFERTVALLEELDRVGDRARLANHVSGLAQLFHDLRARLRERLRQPTF